MAKGKRVEIVKVPITGPEGTTIEVDGKACTKCGEVRALGAYSKSEKGLGGRRSHCRECDISNERNRTLRRNPRARTYSRWSTELLGEWVQSSTGGEYKLIGRFINTKTPTDMRHGACGVTYPVTPKDFFRGRRCPHCFGTPVKTTEQFINEVTESVGSEYAVLGEYLGKDVAIRIRHNICGGLYPVTPQTFLRGCRCRRCELEGRRKSTKQFKDEVSSLVGTDYVVLSEYTASDAYVTMRHTSCGNEYPVTPNRFLQGTRCPFCAESRGERRVREYLTAKAYDFTPQHIFEDCRDIDPLRFDFAVHLRNYDVLIEYDGIQHSEPVDFAGKGELWALEQFRNTQRRDRIKDDYCRANGIDLIRIRHDHFDDIEAILDRELSALGITGKCPADEAAERTSAA